MFFEADVPLPPQTNRMEILQEDTLIKTIPVSPHPPAGLTIRQPAGGKTLSGPATITWSATDPDGDSLYYKVEYSPDGQRWRVLEGLTSSDELVQDFSRLPGGDRARIRVTATDAINTARATSETFSVPVKAPVVYIETPADGSSLPGTDGVFLKGRAYDLQEGWIYDVASLVWTSDRDGGLGSGSRLYLDDLSAGPHVVTLRATGPTGLTATESIQLTITGASGPDAAAPQNLGRRDNVALDYTWTVTFSEPVDPTTVNTANIKVQDMATASTVYTGGIVVGDDGKAALILPPPGDYLPGHSYIITVDGSIRSAQGKLLKTPYIKQFSTIH